MPCQPQRSDLKLLSLYLYHHYVPILFLLKARITQNHPTDCSQQMSHLFYQYHVGREFRAAVKQLKACCLACYVPMLHTGNHMSDTDSSGFPEENARSQ